MDGTLRRPRAKPAGASRGGPDGSAGSLRPIRALLRGLDCLIAMNGRDGVSVTDIARAAGLPRTTAHRILETLCDGGYVTRDATDDRYRATVRVRALADGFTDAAWIRVVARPELEQLCRTLLYPVSLSTVSGLSVLVRETTDRLSPLALDRQTAGARLPLTQCAAGRLHLALCPAAERRALLDVLGRQPGRSDTTLRNRAEFERELDRIRAQRVAVHLPVGGREATMAVPLHTDNGDVAFLSIRYIASAVSTKEAEAGFLPLLRDCAARIAAAIPTALTESATDPGTGPEAGGY